MASEDGVFQGFGAWPPPPPSPLHVDPRIKLVLTKYVSFKLKSWKFSIHFYLTSTNYIHIITIILRKYCYIYIVPVLQKSTVTRWDMYTVHNGYVLKRPYRWTCLKKIDRVYLFDRDLSYMQRNILWPFDERKWDFYITHTVHVP